MNQLARVHERVAAKDYPQFGILKGDKHFYVKIKTGPRSSREMRQKEPFRRSQLTQSEYLSALYDWEDDLASFSDMNDAQEFADRIRELGEEQQEKFDNMPEGLQQGDSGQLLEERASACEQAASDIEDIIADWETEKKKFDELITARDEAQKVIDESDDPEEVQAAYNKMGNLNELDDDFDDSEFIDRVREVSVAS